MRPDTSHTRRFLEFVMPPGTCLEMRIFRATFDNRGNYITAGERFTSTIAGWYDKPDSLIVDAGRLRGISGFVTFNPVNPALLARSDNKLGKMKATTSDDDIQALRFVYIDIDPRRPADISSTDEELGLAIAKRDRLLWEFPEFRESGIWGCSGNGAWILLKLPDLPNTAENRGKVAAVLAALAARYDDDRVTVDVKTKNPARVCCLPGLLKCKGSNRPERPWRLTTVDGTGSC